MTEFEEFWQRQDRQACNRDLVKKAWDAAQRAILRTISKPPYVPKVGDKIRFLGLCHPTSLTETAEVTEVTRDVINVYWVATKMIRDGKVYHSSGVLGEVEAVTDETVP